MYQVHQQFWPYSRTLKFVWKSWWPKNAIYLYTVYIIIIFLNKKQTYSAKIINLICENEAFTAFMYMTIIIMLLFNNKIW